jgi:hypothetical protein
MSKKYALNNKCEGTKRQILLLEYPGTKSYKKIVQILNKLIEAFDLPGFYIFWEIEGDKIKRYVIFSLKAMDYKQIIKAYKISESKNRGMVLPKKTTPKNRERKFAWVFLDGLKFWRYMPGIVRKEDYFSLPHALLLTNSFKINIKEFGNWVGLEKEKNVLLEEIR